MNLYWRLDAIPEFQGLAKAQQQHLWWASHRDAMHTPRLLVCYWPLLPMGRSLVTMVQEMLAMTQNVLTLLILLLVWAVIFAMPTLFIMSQLIVWAVRPFAATRRAAMDDTSATAEEEV